MLHLAPQGGLKGLHHLQWKRPAKTATRIARPSCRPPRASAVDKEIKPVYDVVARARQSVGPVQTSAPGAAGPVKVFMVKLKAAWQIFFPSTVASLTPKEEGKHRLRMILVADRCGMNQSSLYEMRHSIVRAVSAYVDVEAEELVEVNVSMDPDMGTIYSVAVPVRRVKPQARVPLGSETLETSDGITLSWDAEDMESDPSDRFPFGC